MRKHREHHEEVILSGRKNDLPGVLLPGRSDPKTEGIAKKRYSREEKHLLLNNHPLHDPLVFVGVHGE